MDKTAILAALIAGEDEDSPALEGWYLLATERRNALRQEIAIDHELEIRRVASELPMERASVGQAAMIDKLRRNYGHEWIIREPGISLARAIRQQIPTTTQ